MRKRKSIFIVLLFPLLFACKSEKQTGQNIEYPRMVGDIAKDSLIDNSNFKACDSQERVAQYFHKKKSFAYLGEKAAVQEIFKDKFNLEIQKGQDGWIRIRFMVNCNGETGRFRMIQSNYEYEEFKFDKNITDQLMSITKSLDGWEIASNEKFAYDYYQYLIFKMKDGQLLEILP